MSHPVSQLHSSNPALDRLERLVAEVGDLQSKLILLAGNGGKTKLLRSLGERLQSLPVNVGVKLGQRLAATPVFERGFSANELLRDITVSARSNAPLLLDNLEVLFEPSLKINPLDLIKRLAHARSVVAVWPGELRDDRLVYARLGHPEYRDYSLHPLAVSGVPASVPGWIRAGIVEDVWSQFALAEKSIAALAAAVPDVDAPGKQWSDFAKRFGEMLSRVHDLSGKDGGERMTAIRERIKAIQAQSDERLQAWVAARHYADLILQPATKGPVMLHHVPRFLRQRRNAGEAKVALLVFDGLAFDQWVRIREHLIARQQPLAFDENTAFAWLPTVTSVSRQALFSGLRPREFEDSIDHTNKEESLWKAFWHNEGCVAPADVMYRRALRQVEQLDALQADIGDRKPKVLGLVIDEVDERLHNERSKADVAYWLDRWLQTGFVERLFALLLNEGFSIYVTADHGNVDAVGVGRPNQGVIAESRGERVRVYRSESLRADSAVVYPGTIPLDIAGLPANFMPLFACGRSAFVPDRDQVVVHGGVSVEELIVPFVRVSGVNGEG